MANTYTQLYIHVVFAVKGRQNLISGNWKNELEMYITGIVQSRKHKMISIYAMPNHLHILIGMKPDMSVSDLVRDIKAGSSKHINDHRLVSGKFSWQEGFGAFSCSKSQLDKVIIYIQNQEEHHAKKSFREEYIGLLQKNRVDFDEKYLFEFLE